MIAVSVPMALGTATHFVHAYAPMDLQDLRDALAPACTSLAWALAWLTVPCIAVGLATRRWMLRRALQRMGPTAPPDAVERVRITTLFVAASIPQAPAIVALVAAILGADAHAVNIAVAVSTLGVVVIGLDGLLSLRTVLAPRS